MLIPVPEDAGVNLDISHCTLSGHTLLCECCCPLAGVYVSRNLSMGSENFNCSSMALKYYLILFWA